MKAILTCEKLHLNPEDQNIITELAKHNIDAKATIWDDKTNGPTLII
jgi:hypothetical protein